ncbi:thioredoxin family protein [Streptomyces sp. NPDC054796]
MRTADGRAPEREGQVRTRDESGVRGDGGVERGGGDGEAAGAPVLSAETLGVPRLGERATLVQFSSAFCQPCRATRRTLDEVGAMVPGVTHVEIDAEAHLGLVRALGITRTPTVLVLGPGGQIVRRATGQPRKADVIAALGEAVA